MRRLALAAALLLPLANAAHAQDEGEAVREKLFISPMGEPFRRPVGGEDPQDAWFAGADANHDGALSRAEFTADAMRFFAVLDRKHDGEIDPDDIEYYETVLAPEIRVSSGLGFGGGGGPKGGGRRRGKGGGGGGGHRGGGGGGGSPSDSGGGGSAPAAGIREGAARYGYFDYPEPVIVADTNFNRGVDGNEFQHAAAERFALLDTDHDGVIKKSELPRLNLPTTWGGFRGGGGPGGPGGGRRLGNGAQPIDLPPPVQPQQ